VRTTRWRKIRQAVGASDDDAARMLDDEAASLADADHALAGGTFTMGGFLAHFIRPYTVVVGQILLPSVPATLARRVGS